jgi:hypothetical protein
LKTIIQSIWVHGSQLDQAFSVDLSCLFFLLSQRFFSFLLNQILYPFGLAGTTKDTAADEILPNSS